MRWWQAGIIYHVYPRSFVDSGGDGIGDLAGITSRLDYLAALGVDAVWISPFYRSPMADFGYDVADHTDVDPLFGTLADFDALVAEAHRRKIRVLVDFVPNHTSDAHPWFRAARSSRDHPKRDWYLWADPAPGGGPPNNWRSVFGGPAWTLDERTGQYYYHAYLPEQPDLNWRHPEVRAAQCDVLRFWLRRGVDGFRVDACRQLVKDERLRDNPVNPDYHPGLPPYQALLPVFTAERPELLDVLGELRRTLDQHRGDGVLLGEMYLPVERLPRYYGANGEGLHLPSNTQLISCPYRAADIAALIRRYEAALPDHAWPNWMLGNHDRSRIATRVGAAQARVAAMLLLTLRGTPILYYGDEIGMTDVAVPEHLVRDPYARRVPHLAVGRDPERSPMQWSPGPHAGFCPPGATPWLPVSPDADRVNVARQDRDPASLLALYRRLIALRRAERALSVGRCTDVAAHGDVLTYRRTHADRDLLVALNLAGRPVTVPLPHPGRVLLGTDADRAGDHVEGTLPLRGDEGVILAPPRGCGPTASP
ncbi:alpha-amylase family glycosyl hydrolase [Gandjariella thermophila]|uniref:Alpha-amylase n=1 Tax=Gandjariella thermophila TaxID=1931992 RepID=A0A4D4J1C6_9PSEU|nr:alpha-amylase family glycosyl hydrolase [Gandjariella thermophila]GDY28960.1 alpha-amylase [Gandjariella thermophila]